jgi:hypothetical protein
MSYNLPRILNNLNFNINNRDELTFINSNDEHKIPNDNNIKIYSKEDSNLYKLDDNGIETLISGGGGGGSEVNNPLTSDLSIGSHDIINLPSDYTLKILTNTVESIRGRTTNITSAEFGIFTNIQGNLTVPNVKTNQISDSLESSTIDLTVGGINLNSENVNINGGPLRSNIIKTESISSIDDNLNQSFIQLSSQNMSMYSENIGISSGLNMHITTPNLYLNSNPIVYTPYPNAIEAQSFIKSGGLSTQYLLADGSTLQQSAVSGNSNFYLYTNQTNTLAPPSIGHIRYNNTIQKNATIIYISHLTSDNIDIDVFFNNLSILNDVYIQDRSVSSNFIRYNITADPILLPNQYITIPVLQSYFGGTGETTFGNNNPLLLSFFINNEEIDTRISNVETKTQNVSAISGTTTFTGTGGIIVNKITKSGGLASEFLKANGTVDSTSYALNSALTTTQNSVTVLQNKTKYQYSDDPAGSTMFIGGQGVYSDKFSLITGGDPNHFWKTDGSVDTKSYNDIQYIMTSAPITVGNTSLENAIIGTSLSNMTMTFNDQLNYSRNFYISGNIKYLANAVLSIRFRIVNGTVKIPFAITLPAIGQGTALPFIINMNYRIGSTNNYYGSASILIPGVDTTTSFLYSGTVPCSLGNYNRTISAQWTSGASSGNQIVINEVIVKNNYVG